MNAFGNRGTDRIREPCRRDALHRVLRRVRRENRPYALGAHPLRRRIRRQCLKARVRDAVVRVEHARRNLHEFSRMSENDHIFNAALRRAVEHESNKITRLDGSLLRHADSERDALADLARHEYQCVKPCGKSDVDLRHEGILERLL